MVQTLFERLELKFVINAAQRRALVAVLGERLAPDPYGGATGSYPTVDLYFDSPGFELYWERWRGLPSRRKLRLRVYGDRAAGAEPASFLEIKHSLAGRVAKRRVRLTVAEALALCQGADPTVALDRSASKVVAEIQTFVRSHGLVPACIIRCERQAFVGHGDEADLRVTFDQNVGWRVRDLLPRPGDDDVDGQLLGTDPCVLEVKVDSAVPAWLTALVTREQCQLRSHSKFGGAMAASGLVRPPQPATTPRLAIDRARVPHRSLETAWTP
jgi:hypothetical protein